MRLVSPYDEAIDRGTSDVHTRIVAFVEVKWRASGEGLDTAIDAYRLRRVAAAAEAAARRHCRAGDTMRIDVLLLAPGRWPRHIVNAWQP